MDFTQAQQIAREWVESQSVDVTLLYADEDDCVLFFTVATQPGGDESSSVCFNVGCPRKNRKQTFRVWSENNDIAVYLYQIQDFLESCREKTLKEILDTALKALTPVLPGGAATSSSSAAVDSGEEDEAIEDGANNIDEDEIDDEDDDGYYEEPEEFAVDDDELEDTPARADQSSGSGTNSVDEELQNKFGNVRGSRTSVHRLLADLKQINKCGSRFGFEAEPRGDDLFVWDVKLIDFDKKSRLGKDLAKYSSKYKEEPIIYLEVSFPEAYPMAPPFLRVTKPRFQFLTGHVTIGGSICMELLTKSGWRPTNDVESILVQVRSAIMSDPKAQLDDMNPNKPYTKGEAERSFARMVHKYGWNK